MVQHLNHPKTIFKSLKKQTITKFLSLTTFTSYPSDLTLSVVNEMWKNGDILTTNASYSEVKKSYSFGKEIMLCLADCMRR